MNVSALKQRFGIISQSKLLEQALDTAMRVAPTDLTVLIHGESGVGKEVFSQVIHSLSVRKHNPFIAINCGAIPEGTINSELFGHEKGSFTGATGERKGYFETVNGGTIFLDEIGEMPLDTQAFLLRILESGEFIRVGSSKALKTNVRVIAATNIDLRERIHAGKFREDLYYRLSTVPIQIPPLRERPEDIHLLFRKFSGDFTEKYRSDSFQLDHTAVQVLLQYAWPGNIRELKNLAEQVALLHEDAEVNDQELLRIAPYLQKRNLPGKQDASQFDMQEREILYKLLFDMKSDLNDLKHLVFELIRTNDLNIPQHALIPSSNESQRMHPIASKDSGVTHLSFNRTDKAHEDVTDTVILQPMKESTDSTYEVVPNHYSLEEMEMDMIRKALTKYKGRRKDAAKDLGISERTLYRKIKQYNL